MNPYYFECFHCNSRFPHDEIEKNLHYLCENCGEIASKMPLKGVLLIRYNYKILRERYNRSYFMKHFSGQFWKYPELWPLKSQLSETGSPFRDIHWNDLNLLTLAPHRIHPVKVKNNNVLIMDETGNLTGSCKDRSFILAMLKAKQNGIDEITAAANGNAGTSMAGICARLKIRSHIWIAESVMEEKLMQMLAYGSQIHLVKGDPDLAYEICLDLSRKKHWHNFNTAYNPFILEGNKWIAFDIFLELKGHLPAYIFLPVSDGTTLAGIYKGFWELQQLGVIRVLPRLVAVQSSGNEPVVRYTATGKFDPTQPDTIADSIASYIQRNLYLAAHAIHESGGFAVAVNDAEIVDSQKILAERFGILAEPAAAASLAGYLKAKNKLKLNANQKVLMLITGSALKDRASLKRLHHLPSALGEEILRHCYENVTPV